MAASKLIPPLDGAPAADLDRLADDGAWSIPARGLDDIVNVVRQGQN